MYPIRLVVILHTVDSAYYNNIDRINTRIGMTKFHIRRHYGTHYLLCRPKPL